MWGINEYLGARISHCLQLLTNISDDWVWPKMQFKTTVSTVSILRLITALFQIQQQNHLTEKMHNPVPIIFLTVKYF